MYSFNMKMMSYIVMTPRCSVFNNWHLCESFLCRIHEIGISIDNHNTRQIHQLNYLTNTYMFDRLILVSTKFTPISNLYTITFSMLHKWRSQPRSQQLNLNMSSVLRLTCSMSQQFVYMSRLLHLYCSMSEQCIKMIFELHLYCSMSQQFVYMSCVLHIYCSMSQQFVYMSSVLHLYCSESIAFLELRAWNTAASWPLERSTPSQRWPGRMSNRLGG